MDEFNLSVNIMTIKLRILSLHIFILENFPSQTFGRVGVFLRWRSFSKFPALDAELELDEHQSRSESPRPFRFSRWNPPMICEKWKSYGIQMYTCVDYKQKIHVYNMLHEFIHALHIANNLQLMLPILLFVYCLYQIDPTILINILLYKQLMRLCFKAEGFMPCF